MIETSAIFYLPIVTLALFMALGAVDLQRTRAAIRGDIRPNRTR